jgi:hypothetical protein
MVTTRSATLKKVIPGDWIRDEPRSEDGSDSDADEDGNLKGFVVPDHSVVDNKPADHAIVDKIWSASKPRTRGSARLHSVIKKHSK